MTTSITSGLLVSKIVAPKIRQSHCLFAQVHMYIIYSELRVLLSFLCPLPLGLMSGLSKVTLSSGKRELLDRMMEDVSSRESVREGRQHHDDEWRRVKQQK